MTGAEPKAGVGNHAGADHAGLRGGAPVNSPRPRRATPRTISTIRLIIGLVAFVGAFILFVRLRDASLLLSVLVVFVALLLAVGLHETACRELRNYTVTERKVMVGAITGTGLLLLVIWFFARWDGVGIVGVALAYLGVGVAVEHLLRQERINTGWFVGILVAQVVATVVCLLLVIVGLESMMLAATIILMSIPIGLALFSEVILRKLRKTPSDAVRDTRNDADGHRRRTILTLAIFGIILFVVGTATLRAIGMNWPFALSFAGVVLLLMIAITARSNIDVVFVVAAAALAWTLGHRSVPEPVDMTAPAGTEVFGALGDSYISGEGAEEFFEGTNQPGVSTCRRAPTAYAPLLLTERRGDIPASLRFVACSGDEIEDIPGQLANLNSRINDPEEVAFVLLSIGGNDALFGTVGRVCLLPINCTPLGGAWQANLDTVVDELVAVYGTVRDALPEVPIYVVPYPVPIAPDNCGYSIFTGAEHRFLEEFTRDVDAAVAAAVEATDDDLIELVDTMPGALADRGLRLCEEVHGGFDAGDVGVNFLAANSVIGSLEQSINPTNWIHNSLHPNARGHEAMRAAMIDWLNCRAADQAESAPADQAAGLTAAVCTAGEDGDGARVTEYETKECAGNTGDALESCSWEWAWREFARVLLFGSGLGLIPVTVGAWVLALSVRLAWSGLYPEPSETARPAPSKLPGQQA